jgi:hypothetical protein
MTRLSFILVPLLLLLATTAVTAASVSLRWDPNDPAPEGYRVFARKSGQAYNFSQPDWEGTATACTTWMYLLRGPGLRRRSGESTGQIW